MCKWIKSSLEPIRKLLKDRILRVCGEAAHSQNATSSEFSDRYLILKVVRIDTMQFTSPPDPIIFDDQVWDIVRLVPPGKVVTYGQVGEMMPLPEGMDLKAYLAFAPRWVGGAMAACSRPCALAARHKLQGRVLSAVRERRKQRHPNRSAGISRRVTLTKHRSGCAGRWGTRSPPPCRPVMRSTSGWRWTWRRTTSRLRHTKSRLC